MSIDNDAVSLSVQVDINWYVLGHQFAELNDQDQYQFLVGVLDNIMRWEGPVASLTQMDAIVDQFNAHNPALKPELARLLDDLSDRMKLATNDEMLSEEEI